MTSIEWTQRPGTKGETWNPTRGCLPISPGCTNCYAMRQAHRFSGKGGPYEGLTKLRKKLGVVWTGKGSLVADMLDRPLRWREPRTVFVNSMSDLFFEKFTNEEIAAVFGVMAACPQHTFQILTKRARRMREWFEWVSPNEQDTIYCHADDALTNAGHNIAKRANLLQWWHQFRPNWVWPLPNVWLGCSVENQQYADERIPELLDTPAAVRFVSYEPALGPVDFTRIASSDAIIKLNALEGRLDDLVGTIGNQALQAKLDWIIVGGESGPGARPFDIAWARSVIAQCKSAGVACFVKQLGARPHFHETWPDVKRKGIHVFPELKDRKGGDIAEWDEDLRVRNYPEVRA